MSTRLSGIWTGIWKEHSSLIQSYSITVFVWRDETSTSTDFAREWGSMIPRSGNHDTKKGKRIHWSYVIFFTHGNTDTKYIEVLHATHLHGTHSLCCHQYLGMFWYPLTYMKYLALAILVMAWRSWRNAKLAGEVIWAFGRAGYNKEQLGYQSSFVANWSFLFPENWLPFAEVEG